MLPSVAVIWINCTNACTGKKKRPLRQCQVPYRSHTDFCAITDGFVQHWVCSSPFSRSEPVTSPSSSWLRKVTSFRQETRQSYYRNDPVKYNLTWPLSHLSYISLLELIQGLFVNQTIIIFFFFPTKCGVIQQHRTLAFIPERHPQFWLEVVNLVRYENPVSSTGEQDNLLSAGTRWQQRMGILKVPLMIVTSQVSDASSNRMTTRRMDKSFFNNFSSERRANHDPC